MKHIALFFLIEWLSARWVIIVFKSDSTGALLQMLISYPCGHLCYFMSSCDAIRNIRTTCCVFFSFWAWWGCRTDCSGSLILHRLFSIYLFFQPNENVQFFIGHLSWLVWCHSGSIISNKGIYTVLTLTHHYLAICRPDSRIGKHHTIIGCSIWILHTIR